MVLSEAKHINMQPRKFAYVVLTFASLGEPQGWLFVMEQGLKKL